MPHLYTNKAIERAIEGGWQELPLKNTEFRSIEIDHDKIFYNFYDMQASQHDHFTYQLGQTLLSPEFWRCLGKSEGWSMESDLTDKSYFFKWYKFIGHLDEGHDIESFFKSVLKP